MKVSHLQTFTRGWFVGAFEPTLLKTGDFEVAIKHYRAGDQEQMHVHRVATEITAVVSGSAMMNGTVLAAGTIVSLEPGEPSDFKVLEDCITVVVKSPSIVGDKYELGS